MILKSSKCSTKLLAEGKRKQIVQFLNYVLNVSYAVLLVWEITVVAQFVDSSAEMQPFSN